MSTEELKTSEVAKRLRCTPRKVTKLATELRIGANLGGSAGFRFTEAEVEQMRESLRPVAESA